MLSLFPNLLTFGVLSPLLFRLTLALVFGLWARNILKHRKNQRDSLKGLVHSIVALFILIGFQTQLAALIACIYLATLLVQKVKAKAFLTDGVNYYLILFVISLSLLLTGPGVFLAFDLPL